MATSKHSGAGGGGESSSGAPIRLLNGFALLLVFQLAGEIIRLAGDLSIPGPVIGMLLLFLTLLLHGRTPAAVGEASSALLGHLSLLFVPAGVGLMLHFELIGAQWLPLLAALVVSTLLSLVAAGWTMRLVSRLLGDRGADT